MSKIDDLKVLRTVPPFATTHTFCASRNAGRSSDFLRTVQLIQKYISTAYD